MPSTKVANDTPAQKADDAHFDELENGPINKRSCRDPLCCLLFLAFIAGMVAVAIYGYVNGNPTLVGRGYDSDGKMCGIDSGYEAYPYLYFPNPSDLTMTVCVSTCPTSPLPSTITCKTNSDYTSCTNSLSSPYFLIYLTTSYASRYCIPQATETAYSSVSSLLFDSKLLEQWVSDIRQTWPVIAVSIAVAFVIGFIYMIFLRYCSGVLTWIAIICFIAGLAILGWRFYYQAQNTDSANSNTVTSLKVIAYVCWGVAGFTVLAVLCLFDRIRLAIGIMKAAADYVKATPSIFLVPPVIVVLLGGFYAFWATATVFLVSSGDATQLNNTPFGTFTFSDKLQKYLIYHLFGLLWINAFIIASTQFILASSAAIWYFAQGSGQNSASASIRTSVKRLFLYHFGSIAFGSLILAIVQFIRIVLAYMETQAKKIEGKDGKIIKYVLRCLQCYMACFERFIKFLNKNAYIQIALSGKSFCGAAKDAFCLILRNPLRLGVVASIGGVFVLFGKIFVAALTALAAFLVITRWSEYSDQIYSPFIPTLIVFIFAYGVGAIFMTVYGLAADTILACFIVDEELSKKKNSAALHCPESLRTFLEKNKKKEK